MPGKVDHVELALLVRRGQLRFRDIPESDRSQVAAVANALSDAQLQTILGNRERAGKQLGRSFVKPLR